MSTPHQADAFPRKRFFLEMFTRDISLEDCLLDLVDNAIDSLIRGTKKDIIAGLLSPPDKSGAPDAEISLIVTPKEVTIKDNCGGISRHDALHDVFCFGHTANHKTGRLGVYGIGLKRAIFKIGNSFDMHSQTASEAFDVTLNVSKWAALDEKMEDWKIPIQLSMLSSAKPGGHTDIQFKDLRDDVKHRLKDPAFQKTLERNIAQAYCFFLERHVRVKLNGHIVKPMSMPLGSSNDVTPARRTATIDNVTMQFFASIASGEWRQESAGWYVLCNGRVVVAGDKTDLTGWGPPRSPAFHNKYNGFIGIALLQSKDSLALPWTTTKRGLTRESAVYQEAVREMIATARPILSFLNKMYPSDAEANPVERAIAKGAKPTAISDVSKADAPFSTKSRKPQKSTVKVQFDAEKSELDQVRKVMRQPDMSATQIGRSAFDYYLKNECVR